MTDAVEQFDPYRVMLNARAEANRNRHRITHWRINHEAIFAIANHPIFLSDDPLGKPIEEREFLGIPLQLDYEDGSDIPRLEPVIETYGNRGVLIHDHPGPIRHGNEDARFLQAVSAAMEARREMGMTPWPWPKEGE